MKTLPIPSDDRPRLAAVATAFAVVLSTALSLPVRAADAPAAAPKDYTLFVGLDLAVQQDGSFHHVVGATNRGLLVEAGARTREIPTDQAAQLQISRGVKLSTAVATIDNVKTDSVDREAARLQLEAFRAFTVMTTYTADAQDRLQGQMALAATQNFPADNLNPDPATQVKVREAEAAYQAALPGTMYNLDIAGSMLASNLTRASRPTVEISFDVSAPQPLENAYLVVVAEYAADGNANAVARQVSARSLGRIDATPRKVTMAHTASAPGYTFKRFHIGLFADGQEVATTLSNGRLALTEDQAYQFFVANYLIAQKGQTRAPVPMLMTSRADLRRRAEAAPLQADIYAKVDKNGALLALSSDEAGSVPVAAPVAAALQKVRYAPALDKGVPVAGQVKFSLASLVN